MAKEQSSNSSELVWLVTGTSSGLGREIVKSALARGDKVIATARDISKIQDLSSEPAESSQCRVLQLDVTDDFSIIKTRAEEALMFWGRVDVLVNNAGAGILGISEEVGEEGYMRQYRLNFFGALNVTYAFLPHMRERKSGTLVYVGSRSAYRTSLPMLGMYCSSKAALATAAEVIATEVAPCNIRVLNVLPGALRTSNIINSQVYNPPSSSSFGVLQIQAPHFIPDYNALRDKMLSYTPKLAGNQPGDSSKAAEVIVDIVKGEGVGESTKEDWDGQIVLGSDAEKDIREKCESILRNLDRWKEVSASIDFEQPQVSAGE